MRRLDIHISGVTGRSSLDRRPCPDGELFCWRELLGLPSKREPTAPAARPAAGDWITKGVRFPQGTEFRALYKGQTHLGRVTGGALVLNNERFDSPSAAAVSITGNPVNGWHFWQCRLPGEAGWKMIKTLRKTGAP